MLLPMNSISWKELPVTKSTTGNDRAQLYVNDDIRLAILTYNSVDSTVDGYITIPIIPKYRAYGSLNKGGYLAVVDNSTSVTLSNNATYSVGEVVFVY